MVPKLTEILWAQPGVHGQENGWGFVFFFLDSGTEDREGGRRHFCAQQSSCKASNEPLPRTWCISGSSLDRKLCNGCSLLVWEKSSTDCLRAAQIPSASARQKAAP